MDPQKLKPPRRLAELATYLDLYPYVKYRRLGGASISRDLCYLNQRDGGLFFYDYRSHEKIFIPIDCGMTDAETELAFDATGFTVTKFGIALRFDYDSIK